METTTVVWRQLCPPPPKLAATPHAPYPPPNAREGVKREPCAHKSPRDQRPSSTSKSALALRSSQPARQTLAEGRAEDPSLKSQRGLASAETICEVVLGRTRVCDRATSSAPPSLGAVSQQAVVPLGRFGRGKGKNARPTTTHMSPRSRKTALSLQNGALPQLTPWFLHSCNEG